MLTANLYRAHAHDAPALSISLSYEARFLRRRVLTSDDGTRFLLDLPQTTSLDHGGVLICEDGREIGIIAAPETLLSVRPVVGSGSSGLVAAALAQLAWHIGNRHTPCQIEADHLLIQPDHVIRSMLNQLGAVVSDVTAPFTPQGGAYGHGRTHGHSHGDAHGEPHEDARTAGHEHSHHHNGETHSHSHSHSESHSHSHSHTHSHAGTRTGQQTHSAHSSRSDTKPTDGT